MKIITALLTATLSVSLFAGCTDGTAPSDTADAGGATTSSTEPPRTLARRLTITDTWLWANPYRPGSGDLEGYAFITSSLNDRLIGARVDPAFAASIALFETDASVVTESDDTRVGVALVPVDGADIPANTSLQLTRSDVMFIVEGVVGTINVGDTVSITLIFEMAGDRTVDFVIRSN
jgi:copper(I)-binding protein